MKTNIRCLLAAGILLTLLPACTAAGGSTPTAQTVAPAPQVKSVDDYLAVGDYSSALSATDDKKKKEDIQRENLIAYLAKDFPKQMTNPETFSLKDAWYDPIGKTAILQISGKNSRGESLVENRSYVYSSSDNAFQSFYAYADSELGKKTMADSRYKLSSANIANINQLYKKDLLKNVTIDMDSVKHPGFLLGTSDE